MPAVSRRFTRVVLAVLPAAVILFFALQAVLGAEGLMSRHVRQRQLASVETAVAMVESENLRLRRQVRLLQEKPEAVQRQAFEALYMAPVGSTIYLFPDEAAEAPTR
jgi:cell division protein FtsB